eukprot:gene643-biopygen1356
MQRTSGRLDEGRDKAGKGWAKGGKGLEGGARRPIPFLSRSCLRTAQPLRPVKHPAPRPCALCGDGGLCALCCWDGWFGRACQRSPSPLQETFERPSPGGGCGYAGDVPAWRGSAGAKKVIPGSCDAPS